MIAEVASAVAEHSPLRIGEVDYADPTVTLLGPGWSLAITCPWRLMRGSTVLLAWDGPAAADGVWDLVGVGVVGVHERSTDHPYDPVFVLTTGDQLEIAADSDLDPWVLRLPDRTFVGLTG